MIEEQTNLAQLAALDIETCWQAVLTRDSAFDGFFFYAVRSTKVFCRPSCPARRPRREQVTFFYQPEVAMQAGFRACQRCQPTKTTDEPQIEVVKRACQYIEANFDEPLPLASLGQHLHLSPYHLQRLFKRVMGITPRQYIEACRLGSLKGQLKDGEGVTNALYGAGYSSSSRLYERVPGQLGMTPVVYRRGGVGMKISYSISDCALGRLLVGATAQGICAVSLGDSDTELEAMLLQEYPAAQVQRDETDLTEWVEAILSYLAGQQPHLKLPLDVRTTAFKWRVWQELQAIPYGSTRTYSQIAEAIGKPKAVRAVANACATNPVALVTPCHRVLHKDGSLSGYRWGIERKRRLLAQEQAHKPLSP